MLWYLGHPMSHHRHHDHFVEGLMVGTLVANGELSVGLWVAFFLVGGGIEFAFDHIGLLLILGLLAATLAIGVAAIAVCLKVFNTAYNFAASIPQHWNHYLDQPSFLPETLQSERYEPHL